MGTVNCPDLAFAPRCDDALLRGANDGHVAQAGPIDQIGHVQAALVTNANAGVRPISAIDDHRFDLEQRRGPELHRHTQLSRPSGSEGVRAVRLDSVSGPRRQ